MDGLANKATDVRRQRRPKQTHDHGRTTGVLSELHSLVVLRNESSHSEVVRFMRVQHFRCTHFPAALIVRFANHTPNAGQRYFQRLGLRSYWRKQCSLRVAASGRPRLTPNALYPCAWATVFTATCK